MNSSTSAVLRCLLISEIYQLIIDAVCMDTDSENSSKPTLASLNLTCKALHEATIPALWEVQRSLAPLARLFPANTWVKVPLPFHERALQIVNTDKLEWTRFRYYAQNVRYLYWRDRRDVSYPALETLFACFPAGEPLLPNLLELDWHETRKPYFSYVHRLITPTIRALSLTSPDFVPSDTIALLEHVSKTCPHLEVFELHTYNMMHPGSSGCEDKVSDALARLLRGLSELRGCICEMSVSASCVEALATLPKLEALDVDISLQEMKKVSALAARRSREGRWFNALQVFSLRVDQLDKNTETALAAIQSKNLQSLQVQSCLQSETHVVKQHLEAISRASYNRSMLSVELNFRMLPFLDDPPALLNVGQALRPLYALPQIDTIIIRSPALLAEADTLQDIADAWRKIDRLSLISYEPHPCEAPCITLDALAPLARNCHGLNVLEINLSAVDVPDEAALTQLLPEPSQCRLRGLVTYATPIDVGSVDRVAGCLGRLFPHLEKVEYGGFESAWFRFQVHVEHERRWKRVQDLLTKELV